MSKRDRLIKGGWFFAILTAYLGGYFFINDYTAGRTDIHYLIIPGEERIPFYPIFIFGYLTLFGMISFTYAGIQDLDFFKHAVIAFFICIVIHFTIFLLFPVGYNLRPDIDPNLSVLHQIVHFYYWLDKPYNCFPSMHISNAFLIAMMLERYRRGWGWIFYPLAILIAVSVILVKQHYIVDVIAGYFVALFCFRCVWRRARESIAGQ